MLGLLRTEQPPFRGRLRARQPLRLEELESRRLLTAYSPSQILHAYGFDQLPYDGSSQTIAIVTAYDNPGLSYDLGVFDQQYGLPDPVLTIAQPQGQPVYDHGWGLETTLDVEWAHAIAPAADILVVEAKTDSFNNLLGAVNYARQQPGVVVVSMSWGANEFSNEKLYDHYFTTPAGHIGGFGLPGGVTFVAASGDTGAQVDWPAVSPNVLSIGGTTLTLDDKNALVSETGWSGSGGGASAYEPQPDYQLPFQTSGMRTTPDFSYNADLSTAYWVYASDWGGTLAVYGTSAGAPQWAGLIALADQGLVVNGIGSLDGPMQAIPALYNLAGVSYGTYYNDIVDGDNGYAAGSGYDLVTGIGSPFAAQLVEGLVHGARPPGGAAHGSGTTAPNAHLEAGSTLTTYPGILLPRLVTVGLPLSGNAASSTFSSPSSPTQGSVALFPLVPSSPRDQNGGGESGLLANDSEEHSPVAAIVRSGASIPKAALVPVRFLSDEPAVPLNWPQAIDAYFTADCMYDVIRPVQFLG